MEKYKMILTLFGEGGAGAAPAGGGEGGAEAAVVPGVLEDGTQVDNRLAARMEEQARKRQQRGEAPVRRAAPKAAQETPQTQTNPQEAPEPSLEDQWEEAKKGKFKDLFGKDVQSIIQDRFKNQKDANDQLAKLTPALNALARQRGIDEGNLDALAEDILNDDSLFEEEAEKAGMTVEGYRTFQQLQAENERMKAQEEAEREQMFFREHLQGLSRQAEELKAVFPDFDLMKELENPTFRRLTAPNSGVSVKDAFYAVHHAELEPQAMAAGIQRAQNQISQTLQANRARPVEGAMNKGAAADISVDPRQMSREERQRLIERARRGEKIVL